MKFERLYMIPGNEDVYLDCYLNDPIPGFTRKAILVIPGGGYWGVCSDREGEPIAMAFIPYGYNAFVLHYTVERRKKFPAQLCEAALAMKTIREHADKWNVDPAKVFAVGFSAGGHLCGSLGILFDHPAVQKIGPAELIKPTGIMLIYAVVSSQIAKPEQGTFRNLLCSDTPDADDLYEVSLDKHVTKDSSPLFMMHTSNDQCVDIANALVLGQAYHNAGLQFELHVYPDAPHGCGLGSPITSYGQSCWEDKSIAKWVAEAAEWAERF